MSQTHFSLDTRGRELWLAILSSLLCSETDRSIRIGKQVMALQCYQCSGTEDECKKSTLESDKGKYLILCPLGEDKCIRSFLKKDSVTAVSNDCTSQFGCDLSQSVCDEFERNDVTCKVGCCDEDECNVGSHVPLNVILLTVCSALGLALLM